MLSGAQFADVAHVIQVAVAHVFLLSGIGVMLSIFTSRLARIVDRARLLGERLETMDEARAARVHIELALLSRRARVIDRVIALTTIAGLLICLVIAILFVDYLLVLNLSLPVALLFLAAMLCFIGAFGSFLQEVFLATARLRHRSSGDVANRTQAIHPEIERRGP